MAVLIDWLVDTTLGLIGLKRHFLRLTLIDDGDFPFTIKEKDEDIYSHTGRDYYGFFFRKATSKPYSIECSYDSVARIVAVKCRLSFPENLPLCICEKNDVTVKTSSAPLSCDLRVDYDEGKPVPEGSFFFDIEYALPPVEKKYARVKDRAGESYQPRQNGLIDACKSAYSSCQSCASIQLKFTFDDDREVCVEWNHAKKGFDKGRWISGTPRLPFLKHLLPRPSSDSK